MKTKSTENCPFCSQECKTIHSYREAPEGEISFPFSSNKKYSRTLKRCQSCGHFISVHDMDLSDLYEGDYVDATYAGRGIESAFRKIISLPPEKSDNFARASNIDSFYKKRLGVKYLSQTTLSLLDIGSGLGVFPYQMKKLGWTCVALDPDQRAVAHAKELIGTHAICGDFMTVPISGDFDLISFNKVLEHVEDPTAMIIKAKNYLRKGGCIYIEVPDGQNAWKEGPGREEFFIDHLHVFSATSLAMMISKAEMNIMEIETLQEPSTKYTIRAFID